MRSEDSNMSIDEGRRIAMERFGLSSETRDYNIYRILKLARRAYGAAAVGFSIRVRGGESFIALAGADLQVPTFATPMCKTCLDQGQFTLLSDLSDRVNELNCPSLNQLDLRAYIGMPVLSPDKRVIGVMSLFFDRPIENFSEEDRHFLNDYVRLLEDSLIMRGLSIRDPLTQMFNRRYMEQQASIEWRRALRLQVPISVAMIDVDYFKQYNDSAGHSSGDTTLIHLAECIEKHCQRAGDAACRYGGEEFAVILPLTSADQAKNLCERIRREFELLAIPHPARGNEPVTISCGVTTKESASEMEGSSIEKSFQEADEALYGAKDRGRNRVMHFTEFNDYALDDR